MHPSHAHVFKNILEKIGNTPLFRLRSFERSFKNIELYAKLEFLNPGGSVKDRPARHMILDALQKGRLKHGQVIMDPTSGNTGIAYSMIGAALGFEVELVVPGNVSLPRKEIARFFGARLTFSSPMEGSDGAIRLAHQLRQENPERYFMPDQYNNALNSQAHFDTTGPEIFHQTQGRITHFVTGIGTSGTVMGTGAFLKRQKPSVKVYAVEPDHALHGLEGLKHMASSIVPGIYHEDKLDGKISMETEPAWETCEILARHEGLFVGHSSGGNLCGALRIAKELSEQNQEGVIVTIFCDSGERYA